jgi:hypothetical protein
VACPNAAASAAGVAWLVPTTARTIDDQNCGGGTAPSTPVAPPTTKPTQPSTTTTQRVPPGLVRPDQTHLAWLSFWSAGRDQQCQGGAPTCASPTCSSIVQQAGAFAKIFAAYGG